MHQQKAATWPPSSLLRTLEAKYLGAQRIIQPKHPNDQWIDLVLLEPKDRPLVVAETGRKVVKSTMASAWRRAMAAAISAGVLAPDEKFGLHAIKHRAITDTKGTKADKQLASGHKTMQMVHHYDHSLPVVDPVSDG